MVVPNPINLCMLSNIIFKETSTSKSTSISKRPKGYSWLRSTRLKKFIPNKEPKDSGYHTT